jgi:hypothetical protein
MARVKHVHNKLYGRILENLNFDFTNFFRESRMFIFAHH